jgi:hypothetical protein
MGLDGQRHSPVALPPGKRPGTHCIEGWVDPRAGLDWCGKSRPHRDSIPGPSSLCEFACVFGQDAYLLRKIFMVYTGIQERCTTLRALTLVQPIV